MNFFERLFARKELLPASRKAAAKRPIRKQLRLEQLEDRVVPTTYFWTGADGTGLWSHGANWAGGVAPVNNTAGNPTILVFETNLVTTANGTTLAPTSAYTTTDDITNLKVENIIFDNGTVAGANTDTFAEGGVAKAGTTGYTINGTNTTGSLIFNPNTATDGILIEQGVNTPVAPAHGIAGFAETFAASLPLSVTTNTTFNDADAPAVPTTTTTTDTQLTINGTIALTNNVPGSDIVLTVNVAGGSADNAANPGVNLNGVISDGGYGKEGSLTKTGTGTLLLAADNTYGNFPYAPANIVESGVVIVAQSNATSSGLGVNTVFVGNVADYPVFSEVTHATATQNAATDGQILLENGVTVGQVIELDSEATGGAVTTNGSASLTAIPTISLPTPTSIEILDNPNEQVSLGAMGATSHLTINGVIEGGGDANTGGDGTGPQSNLTIEGTGTTEFTGDNTYYGTTTVGGGASTATLLIDNGDGLGVGGTVATDGTTVLAGSSLVFTGNFTVEDATPTPEDLSLAGTGVNNQGALQVIGTGTVIVPGTVTLSGTTNIGVTAQVLELSGVISDGAMPGKLVKVGAGTLQILGTGTPNAANTYSGGTLISAGILNVQNDSATPLGLASGAVQIGDPLNLQPATLQLDSVTGSVTIPNNIVFEEVTPATGPTPATSPTGVLESEGPNTNIVTGNLTLLNTAGSQVPISADTGNTLELFGTISTPGGTNTGGGVIYNPTVPTGTTTPPTGAIYLLGAASNTYGGLTTIDGGYLYLENTAGVAVPGALVIGDNLPNTATVGPVFTYVEEVTQGSMAANQSITINADGEFDLDGNTLSVGPLSLTGGAFYVDAGVLTLTQDVTATAFVDAAHAFFGSYIDGGGTVQWTGTRTFTVTQPTTLPATDQFDLTVESTIADGSAIVRSNLVKAGNGVMALTSANTYSGTTAVNAGALAITNDEGLGAGDGTAASAVSVATGATLALVDVTVDDHTLSLNGAGFLDPVTHIAAAALEGYGYSEWDLGITVTDSGAGGTLATASTLGDDADGLLKLRGIISGTGGVNILSDSLNPVTVSSGLGNFGYVEFSSPGYGYGTVSDANTYAGTTWVEAGAGLELHKRFEDPNNGDALTPETAVPGPLVILGANTTNLYNPGIVLVESGSLTDQPAGHNNDYDAVGAGIEIGTLANPQTINMVGGLLLLDSDVYPTYQGVQLAVGHVTMSNDAIIDIGSTYYGSNTPAVLELTAGLTATGGSINTPTPFYNDTNDFGEFVETNAIISTTYESSGGGESPSKLVSVGSGAGGLFDTGGDGILLLAGPSQSITVNPIHSGSSQLLGDLAIDVTVSGGTPATDGTITDANPVSGNAGLIKNGTGVLILASPGEGESGITANTQGFTTVTAGQLWLDGDAVQQIPFGTVLTVGNTAAGIANNVVVKDLAGYQVDDASVVVNNDGEFILDGNFNGFFYDAFGTQSDTQAALTMVGGTVEINDATLYLDGPVSVLAGPTGTSPSSNIVGLAGTGVAGELDMDGGSPTFTVAAGATLNVSAEVVDGGLTKDGPGKMVLSGEDGIANTYSGTTVILEGTLVVNDAQPQSAVALDPTSGETATLAGTGTVGSISTPGAGVSIQAPGLNSPGILNVTGDDTFAANSQYQVVLGGVGGVTAYTQLIITGAATLNGAFLNVTVPGSFPSGTPFDILQAAGGVTGEFTALVGGVPTLLTNGATFTSTDGKILQITYDANDVILTVLAPATTTVVTGNPNPAVFGHAVTLTATVTNTSSSATPAGSIEFYDNGTPLGAGTLSSSSGNTATYTFTTTTLPSGPQMITAQFTPTGNFQGSTSTAITEDVGAVTSSTLTSSPNPSTVQQQVTFTDTVTNTSNNTTSPTGSVSFYVNGTTLLGTVPNSNLVVGGNTVTATLTTSASSLPAGVDTITAVFTPTGDFESSTGTLTQTVEADTSLAASGNPNPVAVGHSVTLSATVSNTDGTNGTPTGSVEFFDNTTDLGAGQSQGNGVYTLSTTSLPSGPQTIKAVYTATGAFVGSQTTFTEDVQAATTGGGGLTSSQNPSTVNQSVTFTDTVVNQSGSATPTGTVEFFDNTGSGTPTDLGAGTEQTTSGNTATYTFSTSALPPGQNDISAVYTPTPGSDFQGSTNTLLQTVNSTTTSTVVADNPNPSVAGQSVTLTATVSNQSVTGPTPTGTVEFFETSGTSSTPQDLGAGTLQTSGGNSAVYTFTTTNLPAGDDTITAKYTPSGNFVGSQGQTVQHVQAVTSGTVTGNPNPANSGQAVTLTATFVNSSSSATPTGTVEFFANGVDIGPGSTVSGGGNTVTSTLTTSSLPPGTDNITAKFTPTAGSDFAGSTTAAGTETINGQTSVTVSSSATPSTFGQSVTFTATVKDTSTGGGVPTGTVQFFDNGTALGSAQPVSGTGTTATATVTTSSLQAGNNDITAVYTPSGNFVGSNNDSAAFLQVVAPAPSTTLVTVSNNNPAGGDSVTYTASVTSSVGTPSGTVQFFDNGLPLSGLITETNGLATFTLSSEGIGNHIITAVFTSNNSNFTSSDSKLNQVNVLVGTQAQRYVEDLYQLDLGRPGSIAEVNGYVSADHQTLLQTEAATVAQIGAGVEARNHQVDLLYQKLLNRHLDLALQSQGGDLVLNAQGFQVTSFDTMLTGPNASVESVAAAIIGYQEFQNDANAAFPGQSQASAFVSQLYKVLLGRATDSQAQGFVNTLTPYFAEVANATNSSDLQAANNALSSAKASIAMQILESPEYRMDQIRNDYFTLLGRTATTLNSFDLANINTLANEAFVPGINQSSTDLLGIELYTFEAGLEFYDRS